MSGTGKTFASDNLYHIYNRGVDKRTIFMDGHDMQRFFQSMIEFNTADPIGSLYENSFRQLGGPTPKLADEGTLVAIVAYCLNPNHFHFILKQTSDGGISEFMKRLSGGYTLYFNNKHGRNGSLFQGKFKSVHVDSNEYLLHLSAYVNLNDRVHQLGGPTPKLVGSKSSWGEYGGESNDVQPICEKDIILDQFDTLESYKEFAQATLEDVVNRRIDLKNMEPMFLE